jgi:pimeloyl-ACP methyl ester carboxylesterase
MIKTFQPKLNNLLQIEGKGKTVVLIHGYGEDSKIFDAQINYFKNHCQLIVPDLPGSGNSTFLNVEHTVTVQDYAQCIEALLHTKKLLLAQC